MSPIKEVKKSVNIGIGDTIMEELNKDTALSAWRKEYIHNYIGYNTAKCVRSYNL